MQIILVSRHLKTAKTVTIMPRHVMVAFIAFLALVLATSLAFSWMSVRFRLPIVEDLVVSIQNREATKAQEYLKNNISLMATRLGELQARVLQLDMLGERVETLSGLKRDALNAAAKGGQGGPLIPALLDSDELQREIDRMAAEVDRKSDDWAMMEARLLEKRVRDRRTPTALPVRNAVLGSPFGRRSDPIAGVQAMHEGMDFSAEIGTPVMSAADGVVVSASYHPEFGNMIDIDHGDGLISRYAHLSEINVVPGKLVKRGEGIGTVGTTGRSTGPHLHFEVRMMGVAQNPAAFLKQGAGFAQLKQR